MKRSLVITVILVAAISFVSCSKSSEQTVAERVAPSSQNEQKDISSTQTDFERVVGTYVGVHGSGLVLHDNGSAEYYWKEWPSVESVSWRFDNNQVIVKSDNLGYEFYANVPDGTVSSLTFEADTIRWDDEVFLKTSDDTQHLDKDGFVALIEATLKTKLSSEETAVSENKNPADIFECGKLSLKIPGYYHGKDGYYIYEEEDRGAIVKCSTSKLDSDEIKDFLAGLSDDELNSAMSDFVNSHMEDYSKILASKDRKRTSNTQIEHEGYYIERITEESIYENNGKSSPVKEILYVIYEPDSLSSVWCFIFPKDASNIEADFDAMMKEAINAAPVIKDSIPEQKKSHSGSTKASTGNKSPVIEAIDSYEAFIDDYIELMNEIKNNPSDTALLGKYADYMAKYADLAQKFEDMEDEDMTDEEALYYAQVSARISKKLLDSMQ